jgi:hypothetical protein
MTEGRVFRKLRISRKGIIPKQVYGMYVNRIYAKSLYTPEWECLCKMLTLLRVEKGLTQSDLGIRLGQPQSLVCKVESGQRKLDLRQFVIYVRCLDASPMNVLERFLTAFPQEG